MFLNVCIVTLQGFFFLLLGRSFGFTLKLSFSMCFFNCAFDILIFRIFLAANAYFMPGPVRNGVRTRNLDTPGQNLSS